MTSHPYGDMTPHVLAFVAQLRRTPVAAWRHAAETDRHMEARPAGWPLSPGPGPNRDDDPDQLARARLREVMNRMPDVARRIRARIDHEISALDGIAPPPAVASMRRAARLAMCSLAARPFLEPEVFARLYRPFTGLIPIQPHGAPGVRLTH
jgi:hypothetical protein